MELSSHSCRVNPCLVVDGNGAVLLVFVKEAQQVVVHGIVALRASCRYVRR